MAQPATHLEWVGHRLEGLCYSALKGDLARSRLLQADGEETRTEAFPLRR
jgi:hypothetical protein